MFKTLVDVEQCVWFIVCLLVCLFVGLFVCLVCWLVRLFVEGGSIKVLKRK